MSCHFYQRRLPPPGISAWTKIRLGWLDPSKIRTVRPGETREIPLGPLADGSWETLAIRIPLSASTYYLIENRQPLGYFDKHLPGSGVLILYADDRIPECRHGKAPVRLINADPFVDHLKGAAFDVGNKASLWMKKEAFGYNFWKKPATPIASASLSIKSRAAPLYRPCAVQSLQPPRATALPGFSMSRA